MIKISDIKEIYTEKSSSQSNIQKLKEQLDGLIEQGDWEVCDVIEHDCFLAPYHLLYNWLPLQKHIYRGRVNALCVRQLLAHQLPHALSSAALCRMDELILHPNVQLYNFIRGIEAKFVANLKLPNVYSATVNHILDMGILSFPCYAHKEEIMAWVIHYHLTMRMQIFSRKRNSAMEKQNCVAKKRAKFCRT
ncbi:hypothetical protein J437_LFUL001687 [Ladona fulva]|uniref:Uncharacterized protein n=1 Tax=Ladona fulva TaxID=123851 RepID=A0A8K0K718_LADFU|nr:hypothetical protein J437_LFUL001687 [Ladona fulva]